MQRYKIDPALLRAEKPARAQAAAREEKRAMATARTFICISFCLLLLLIGILSLALPKPTVSEYERRELAAMPEFSVNELFWGSYLRDVEMFYADTFPFRDTFVQIAARVDELRGIRMDGVRIIDAKPPAQEPEPAPGLPAVTGEADAGDDLPDQEASEATPYQVVDDGAIGEQTSDGLFIYKNKAMAIFGGSKNMGSWYAETLNNFSARVGPGVNVYDMVIPTSIEFGLPDRYKSVSNSEKEAIDHIYSELDGVTGVDAYSAIHNHAGEYVYFNTDHHWTALGAYYAYTAFCEAAGLTPLSLDDYDKRTIEGNFLGTLYNQSNDSSLLQGADTVDYYVLPGEFECVRYDRGAPNTPISSVVWNEGVSGGNSYLVFISGDSPLTEIRTPTKNGKKAVLVKESFGNAYAPFLLAHYEEVYVVDHRYYEKGLVSLVQEKGIDDVIFLKNVFAANTAYHIECIEGLFY